VSSTTTTSITITETDTTVVSGGTTVETINKVITTTGGTAAPVSTTLLIPNVTAAPTLSLGTGSDLIVTWAPPVVDATHSAATSFNLRSATNGAGWGSAVTLVGVSSPYQLTGLAADTVIDVEIQSVNAAGASAWSAFKALTTAAGSVTPPTSTNVYPLTFPTGVFTVGTGDDTLTVPIGYADQVTTPYSVSIILDGVAIAAPVVIPSTIVSGQNPGQVFTIKGNWGPNATPALSQGGHTIEIAGIGNSIDPLTIGTIEFDFIPYAYASNGETGPQSFFGGEAAATWELPVAAVGTPTSPTTPVVTVTPTTASTIDGATINGVAAAANTLQGLVTAAASATAPITLTLPAATIIGVAQIPVAMTITGAGPGATIIDATGQSLPLGKAALVTQAVGVVISGMTIQCTGPVVSGGAAVRDSLPPNGTGASTTLQNVNITGFYDGILTSGGSTTPCTWTLDNVNISGCGGSDGLSHAAYFNGGPADIVITSGCTFTAGTNATHAMRNHCGTFRDTGSTFTGADDGGASGSGNAGSTVDHPDGGLISYTGSTISLSVAQSNTNILQAGEAATAPANAATGTTVTCTDVVFGGNAASPGDITGSAALSIVFTNSVYDAALNATAPVVQSWGTVTGTIASSTPPVTTPPVTTPPVTTPPVTPGPTTTLTIGAATATTAAGTYPDINAAVAAVPGIVGAAGLAGPLVFEVTAGGITTTVTQTIKGFATNGFSTTLQSVAGQGWRDYLKANPTVPKQFNQNYGAFLYTSTNLQGNGGNQGGLLNIQIDDFDIVGMQLQATDSSTATVYWATANCLTSNLDSNIIYCAGYSHNCIGISASNGSLALNVGGKLTNNLLVGTLSSDNAIFGTLFGDWIVDYNTFAMPLSSIQQGTAGGINGVLTCDNNAFIGFGVGPAVPAGTETTTSAGGVFGGAGTGSTATNNACSLAVLSSAWAYMNTNAVLNALPAECFVNAGATIADWDFTLSATSPLKGAATSGAGGIVVDAIGNPRNTADDIGCFAFVA
jgi:hypothetical protein